MYISIITPDVVVNSFCFDSLQTLYPYWPQGSGATAAFEEVILKTESETIGEGFVKRSVKISQEVKYLIDCHTRHVIIWHVGFHCRARKHSTLSTSKSQCGLQLE